MICLTTLSAPLHGATFREVVDRLENHEATLALKEEAQGLGEEAKVRGSWGDPTARLAFRNFPKDSLKDDETPMTGMEWGLSQRIALTTKYRNKKRAYQMLSQSKLHEARDQKRRLVQLLWDILIEERKLVEEEGIFRENLQWITKMLTASKKLYANGKLSGQGLLDIQIRKAEIESLMEQKSHERKMEQDRLSYLVGVKEAIDRKTIPWNILVAKQDNTRDTRRPVLESLLQKAQYNAKASKLAYVPDVNVSLGYTEEGQYRREGGFPPGIREREPPHHGKCFSGPQEGRS